MLSRTKEIGMKTKNWIGWLSYGLCVFYELKVCGSAFNFLVLPTRVDRSTICFLTSEINWRLALWNAFVVSKDLVVCDYSVALSTCWRRPCVELAGSLWVISFLENYVVFKFFTKLRFYCHITLMYILHNLFSAKSFQMRLKVCYEKINSIKRTETVNYFISCIWRGIFFGVNFAEHINVFK